MGLFLGDTTIELMQRALTGLSLREQVISNNLANLNTPGFKASEVVFESELRRALEAQQRQPVALEATHPAHFTTSPRQALDVRPIVRERADSTLRADGNNVDLEREMAALAETAILYQASAQIVARKFALLRAIITEGRK
ncbi:MAG: flagellar basal body rod protein FlgB [Anaerolineae bacterium]|nr:flagellar basal body rod protein FlgB [Anaerolineae bacterium]